MLQQFQSDIERWCKATDKILLAISGGIDSMVMFHLFRQVGYTVQVAHCNFQLRGKESDLDEQWIKQQCEIYKVPYHTIRFDTSRYANSSKISTQMAARKLRYAWFFELLRTQGLDWVATAHHQNDAVETVLLNLCKGAGLDGLLGIPSSHQQIIRPLLSSTRADIHSFALQNEIVWREDSSNDTNHYQRNFVRHEIIPQLKTINPSLEKAVEKTIQKLTGYSAIVTQAICEWKEKYAQTNAHKTVFLKAGFHTNHGIDYQITLLYELLKESGFHFNQCRGILQGILNGQSGKRFFSVTHCLTIDRQCLILTKQSEHIPALQIQSNTSEILLSHQKLSITHQNSTGQTPYSSQKALLDTNTITFPLIWRKWRPGDFFYPAGMNHKKKISDFLIDAKVPRPEKDTITVLESAGDIIWVVGYRIDNRFKATHSTPQVLAIQLIVS